MIPMEIQTHDHLVELFGKLVGAAGLAPTVCGPIGPRQLYENLVRAAPFLNNTYVRPEDGLACVETPTFDMAWSIFTNGNLSVAIFILTRFDGNFSLHLLRMVMNPFKEMASATGLTSSIAGQGKADEDVVSAMRGAHSVPMDALLTGGDINSPTTTPAMTQNTGGHATPRPQPQHAEPNRQARALGESRSAPQYRQPMMPPPPPPPPAAAPPPRPAPPPTIPSGPAPDGGYTLTAGANTSLRDGQADITIDVELGWFTGAPGIELDASAILLGTDRRVCSDEHFVFFNNPRSPDGAVELTATPRTNPEGYQVATISVRLNSLSPQVDSIVFPVSIYEAPVRGQSFGMIPSAYARVRSRGDAQSQATFVMTNSPTTTESAMVFCEVYRRGDAWKLRAIGQGYATGLAGIATDYGVDVS